MQHQVTLLLTTIPANAFSDNTLLLLPCTERQQGGLLGQQTCLKRPKHLCCHQLEIAVL